MRIENRTKYFSTLMGLIAVGISLAQATLIFEKSYFNSGWAESKNAIFVSALSAILAAAAALIMIQMVRQRNLRERRRQVFIIYDHSDRTKANEIAQLLRENGLEPWLDVENLLGGQIWHEEIARALENSAMAIVLISKKSLESNYFSNELKAAISQLHSNDRESSPIVPVVLDASKVPSDLAHIQYVDFGRKDAKEYLVRSLNAALDRVLGNRNPT